MRAPVALLVYFAALSNGVAGGIDVDTPSPRAIGRAGNAFVSDDGEGALSLSPAAIARRADTRFRVGLSLHDRDSEFTPNLDAVAVEDRSQPVASPTAAILSSWRALVFGIAYREPQASDVRLAAPAFGQPEDDVIRLFPYRYSGYDFRVRARELRVGAALRVGEAVAVGASFGARHTRVEERRFIWPGFSGRDGLLNPSRDVRLVQTASDSFAPAASIGVLLAPTSLPIEVTLGASGIRGATVAGALKATGVQLGSPGIDAPRGRASAELPDQLVLTSGARIAHGRFAAELGALARFYRGGTPWSASGVTLFDESGLTAELAELPRQWRPRNHASYGAAIEAELLPELLWSTIGYRYTLAPTSPSHFAPTTTELGGHTLALGIEFYVGGITATVGYSRSLARNQSSNLLATTVVNPFDGGTDVTGDGRYRRADDRVGFALEVAYDSFLSGNDFLDDDFSDTESSTSTNAP